MPPPTLSPQALTLLAFALAIAGLVCFLWPTFRRLSGRADAPQGAGATIRSPLWWTGFLLTAAALMVQRMAAGG